VWLYFLITIGLTLLMLGVWRKFAALKKSMGRLTRVWLKRRERERDDEEAGKKGL
jgi:hypothetical protein